MWILYLNPMVECSEAMHPVARAETRDILVAFLVRESVPPYTDEEERHGHGGFRSRWHKCFRKGGPLEWYNPPTREDQFQKVPELEEYLTEMRARYIANLAEIPEVQP